MGLGVFLGVLAGCGGNRIDGTIEGQVLEVGSGWFTYEPEAYGDDGRLTVSLATFEQACSAMAFWRGEEASLESPAALAASWEAAFPADWWQVDLVARTASGAWPTSGRDWAGVRWNELLDEAVRVRAAITHHVAHRDAAYFRDDRPDLVDYVVPYTSDLGIARWRRVQPGNHVQGRFNTFAVDEDGFDAGRIELHFSVGPCEGAVGPL